MSQFLHAPANSLYFTMQSSVANSFFSSNGSIAYIADVTSQQKNPFIEKETK
jgi:hypothetical protein